MQNLIPSKLKELLAPYDCYLVGGSVRDYLINHQPFLSLEKRNSNQESISQGISAEDYDFVIFNLDNQKEILKNIAKELDINFVELDDIHGHYRLVNKDQQFDFALPRGKNIEEDLKARDFTINSIAYSLQEQKIIDPFNFQEDIKNKKIKMISSENLEQDRLRCLRAFRFAANLNFEIEKETLKTIQEIIEKSGFQNIARERISYEFNKLLESPNSYKYLFQMYETGVLESFIPEMKELRKVPPNNYHHLWLFEHTLELIKQYEKSPLRPFLRQREITIKLSCLFHDIAKPQTWQIEQETGKHTFYNHDLEGAELTEKILKRLNYSSSIIKDISLLVRYHLTPFQITKPPDLPSQKACFRFFRKVSNIFHELMKLAEADLLSICGPEITEQKIQDGKDRLNYLINQFGIFQKKENQEPLLLQGDNLKYCIDEAGLKPTKFIKELLEDLRELQLEGKIKNTAQAAKWFIKEAQNRET